MIRPSILIRIFLLLSIFVSQLIADQAIARESKEVRKQHTFNLRRFIQLVDFTYDDREMPKELKLARRQELDEKFNKIAPKLSKKRKAEFTAVYNEYVQGFKEGSTPTLQSFENLRAQTLKLYRVITVPALVPNRETGKQVYKKYCEVCVTELEKKAMVFSRKIKRRLWFQLLRALWLSRMKAFALRFPTSIHY